MGLRFSDPPRLKATVTRFTTVAGEGSTPMGSKDVGLEDQMFHKLRLWCWCFFSIILWNTSADPLIPDLGF